MILAYAKPSALPVKGDYYTVRGSMPCPGSGKMAVYLNEIVCNLHPNNGLEFGWSHKRFRKAESDHSEADTVQQAEPVGA